MLDLLLGLLLGLLLHLLLYMFYFLALFFSKLIFSILHILVQCTLEWWQVCQLGFRWLMTFEWLQSLCLLLCCCWYSTCMLLLMRGIFLLYVHFWLFFYIIGCLLLKFSYCLTFLRCNSRLFNCFSQHLIFFLLQLFLSFFFQSFWLSEQLFLSLMSMDLFLWLWWWLSMLSFLHWFNCFLLQWFISLNHQVFESKKVICQ